MKKLTLKFASRFSALFSCSALMKSFPSDRSSHPSPTPAAQYFADRMALAGSDAATNAAAAVAADCRNDRRSFKASPDALEQIVNRNIRSGVDFNMVESRACCEKDTTARSRFFFLGGCALFVRNGDVSFNSHSASS